MKQYEAIRVNIRVSREVKDFFEKKSLEMGTTQSSLMSMVLNQYVDQQKALKFTPDDLRKLLEMAGGKSND